MKPNKQHQLIQAMLIFNPKLTVGQCARRLNKKDKKHGWKNTISISDCSKLNGSSILRLETINMLEAIQKCKEAIRELASIQIALLDIQIQIEYEKVMRWYTKK